MPPIALTGSALSGIVTGHGSVARPRRDPGCFGVRRRRRCAVRPRGPVWPLLRLVWQPGLVGMTSIRSRGPSSDSGRRGTPREFRAPSTDRLEGLFAYGRTHSRSGCRRVPGRDAAPPGRLAGRPGGAASRPAGSARRRRGPGGPQPAGHRHLPGVLGRGPLPGLRGRAPRDPDARRSRWAPTTSISNGRPPRRWSSGRPRRAPASCCRATTSIGSRPT